MTWRSCLLVAVAIVAAAVGGCSSGEADSGDSAEAPPVLEIDTVATVGRSSISESLELVGTLFPWRFAAIVPEVEGVIARLPAHDVPIEAEVEGRKFSMPVLLDMGHEVEEGAILAQIDERPFRLALDAAQARLDVAQRELENLLAWKRPEEIEQLQAQAAEAEAVLKRAKADRDRLERLRGRQVVSASEWDAASAAYDTALAAKRRTDAAVKLAQAGPTPEEIKVAEAQVALAEAEVAQRKDELEKCTIHCPYDAVIVDRLAGVGDRVTPQTPIMQIIDPKYLLAEVAVPEKYQHLVNVNDMAEVEARGVAEPVPGLVALVNEKIDLETRTFRIRVGVENPREAWGDGSGERLFKAGSYVRVRLAIRSAPDTLVVPSGAMTFDEGQPAVFVFRRDHVEKRPVSLGIRSRTEYEVTEGLSEGDQVVVGDTALLTDGLPVRLKQPRAAAAASGDQRAVDDGLPLAMDSEGAQP
jgi:multidrug efflux pump subunit AcrA (membrane-fusion protein)